MIAKQNIKILQNRKKILVLRMEKCYTKEGKNNASWLTEFAVWGL